MKLLLVIFSHFIILLHGNAQSKNKSKLFYPRNLIANGSFEDINKCTEFDALCEPEAWFFLPTYSSEPQGNDSNRYEVLAITNVKYGGRAGYYIYSKLLCPLKEGKSYKFSIWVNTPQNEFEHLDIYFSYQEPTNHLALNTVTDASIRLTEKYAEAAYKKWKRYSYIYKATGEERFITIGNFTTDTIQNNNRTANNKNGEVLYALDNVTLYPVDNKENICKEYFGIVKQLYEQNYRHPARLLSSSNVDTNLNEIIEIKKDKKVYTKSDTLIIPDILFQSNSSKINPAFESKLQSLIFNMRIRHFSAVEIIGHTDNIGSEQFNIELSLKRANAIKDYIINHMNISSQLIEVLGKGESEPKNQNNTAEGRTINRRVEIILKS